MAVETHPRIAARTGDAALAAKGGDAELGDMFAALLTGATLPEEEGAPADGEGDTETMVATPDETDTPVDPLIGIALATIPAEHPAAPSEVSLGNSIAPARTNVATPPAVPAAGPDASAEVTISQAQPDGGPDVTQPVEKLFAGEVIAPRTHPFVGPQVSLPVEGDDLARSTAKHNADPASPVASSPGSPQPHVASAFPTPGTRTAVEPQVMRPVETVDADTAETKPAVTSEPITETPKPAAAEKIVAALQIGKVRILNEPPVMRPAHETAQPVAAQPATAPQQTPEPVRAPQTALQAMLAQAGIVVAPEARAARTAAIDTPKLARAVEAPPATVPGTAAPVAQLLPESLQMMVAPVQQPQAIDMRAATADQPQPLDQLVEQQLDLAHESEWLDRLARDIAGAGAKDGTMRFRLAPEHLGNLQVELKQQAAGAAVRLTAETEAARAILAEAHPRLIAEARAQGVRIAEAHVDLGSGRNPQQEAADQRRQDQPAQPAGQSVLRGKKSVTNSALTMTPRTADRFA